MRRTIPATVCLLIAVVAAEAWSSPRPLSASERAEITALARHVVDAVRDGERDPAGVFPTAPELRAVFGVREAGDASPDGGGLLVQRQLEALSRDARDLRPRLAGATFRGIVGSAFALNVIDPRRCGRFGAPGSQCADGPVVEYTVHGAVRRFRIDTLVRISGRWRVLDLKIC